MSKQNLQIWDAVSKTDPAFTKGFSRGGGFRGTATNATYLAKKATEVFGPIGTGWGVEVLEDRYVDGVWIDERNRESTHVVLVKLWYVLDGKRGEVQQYGQTTYIGKNKHGAFSDEEHAKKSLTDAMTKCMSLLGFSADIHMGRYDDNKYVAEVTQEFAEKHEAEARAAAPRVSEKQALEIEDLIAHAAADRVRFLAYFKVKEVTDLGADQYESAKALLNKKAKAA